MLTGYSNRVLLHLLRLRSTFQPPPQAAETIHMATIDHGGMGNSDDFDGHRTKLQGLVDRAPLPGGHGSRSIPWSGLLYYHVVLPR